jgi:hypothetical protein
VNAGTATATAGGGQGRPVITLPGLPATAGFPVDTDAVVAEMLRRASSAGFGQWWRRAESVGFCAHPIQLTGTDRFGRQQIVWTRCNNRRAQVCPSCSDLYARDTWQLVHAGAAGGHHDIPATVSRHPQVFVTLTAPGFGPVHNAAGNTCRDHHPHGAYIRCQHGKPLWCSVSHDYEDEQVGQPFCGDCYDYLSHVLFTWHMPELWRRFTIALRRAVRQSLKSAGVAADSVRVSFVKVVEMQARAVPHIHALIRLDPADADTTGPREHTAHGPAATCGGGEPRRATQPEWQSPVTAVELATLINKTVRQIAITVPDPCLGCDGNTAEAGTVVVRFGTQIDTQPVTGDPSAAPDNSDGARTADGMSARRVARYLAKYVTKSLHDFGIAARRLSAEAIACLDVSEHIRTILTTLADLADCAAARPDGGSPWAGIGRWLHTLGYRGHITTKSRHYSTTMTTLRSARAQWTRDRNADAKSVVGQSHRDDAREMIDWEFDQAGHTTIGDLVLAVSASLRYIDSRRTGLVEARSQPCDLEWDRPRARDD